MSDEFDEVTLLIIFISLFMINVTLFMFITAHRLDRIEKMISEQAVTMVEESAK